MSKKLRNILVAPIAIFVRFPVMATLRVIVVIGELADKGYEKAGSIIPGMRL